MADLADTGQRGTTIRDIKAPDGFYAYGIVSVAAHWLTVIAIIALVVTEGPLHASIGLVLSLPLLWRIIRRFFRGFPRLADQPILLSFLERMTIITMLLALAVLAVTGCLMPLFEGRSYELFGWSIGQVAWAGDAGFAAINASAHAATFHVFMAALSLHILAVIKHILTIRDGILLRIVKPIKGSK